LLNDNDLTSLPDSIANLKNIQICSLANNRLQNLSPQVQEWASHVDPKGMGMQGPASK
jgi:Leucine-rich repeat (LRR) protein